MKSNTKSSITLPVNELELVELLMKSLGAKSKVEVIRRGLHLLKDKTDREALRKAYKEASEATKANTKHELDDLDSLTSEGLE